MTQAIKNVIQEFYSKKRIHWDDADIALARMFDTFSQLDRETLEQLKADFFEYFTFESGDSRDLVAHLVIDSILERGKPKPPLGLIERAIKENREIRIKIPG